MKGITAQNVIRVPRNRSKLIFAVVPTYSACWDTNWASLCLSKNKTIVHLKRLGSRHIHKVIKLQGAMNGMDRILCKEDLILIRRPSDDQS